MSYDIRLVNPQTRETVQFGTPHQFRGGTYAVGGTTEAWLNVTYNYSKHFYRVFSNPKGIRALYGMTAAASIVCLDAAIAQLADDVCASDYWNPTEGNAKVALLGLKALALASPPDSLWEGD